MKITFLSIVLILCGLSFYSCSNEEDVYSCDPEVNEWVKENKSEIEKMTRSNLLEFDNIQIQKAVYAAFSSSQKANVWKEKLSEVLKLGWSAEEKEHLQKVHSFITDNPNIFDSEMTDTPAIFFYKWGETAQEKFQWDNKTIYSLIGTLNKVIDKNGNLLEIQHSNSVRLKTSSESSECDCYAGASVSMCETWNGKRCVEDWLNCPGSFWGGCGPLWLNRCNGNCE